MEFISYIFFIPLLGSLFEYVEEWMAIGRSR